MEKTKMIIAATGVWILLFSYVNMTGNNFITVGSVSDQTNSKSTQTKPKTTQTVTKSTQTKPATTKSVTKSAQTKPKTTQSVTKSAQTKSKTTTKSSKPATVVKSKETGTTVIGTQTWASANLNVSTFRNGDTIPEAKTNKEWIAAGESGKPAWCYYNNEPKNGPKYGKLYNWHAVNDERGLAPAGWSVPNDADWAKLTNYLGGPNVAGNKLKNTEGWSEDYNGNNQSGFGGFPGGYRAENGSFSKIGSVGTWWSSTESKALNAVDFYLSRSGSINRSISPKQLGESVRCVKK
jgi:uncharacterized protein (TIGR02145 family)